jgi:putative isomerase
MHPYTPQSAFLTLLHNQINPSQVPFSDRGSRLLIYKQLQHDRLYIKLAERLTRLQPGVETYLTRPPFIPELSFIDEDGHDLDFQLSTYPHALVFQTRVGAFALTFDSHDTITIGLPPGEATGIRMCLENTLIIKEENGGAIKSVRDVYYRTNSKVKRHGISTTGNMHEVFFILEGRDDLTIHLTPERERSASGSILPFSTSLREAEMRWHDWFSKAPPYAGPYQKRYYYAWWVMANNLVSPLGHLRYEAMMPSKHFYVGVWNWDACFHALALRHIDPQLARDQLRTMLAWQLPNGMIPDVVYDEGIVDHIDHPVEGTVTKPPLIAWSALKIHEIDPNLEFLREIYPSIVRWNKWWFSQNDDNANGIVQYTHPYSSGLDDSPLWDHGLPVESPDLSTYLYMQMESLGEIAQKLELEEEASRWHRRAGSLLERMIGYFYDPDAGLFWAKHEGRPIPEMTPFNLYPLWTGKLPREIDERLIAHLTNENEFWGPHPLRTVARNSKSYSPETMWRGPVWANINYIFVEALSRSGHPALAQRLRKQTLDLLAQNDGLYEFYNPETGKPAEHAVPMFGWTAAVFIDLLLQEEQKQKSAF